jgi:hypothetical protein
MGEIIAFDGGFPSARISSQQPFLWHQCARSGTFLRRTILAAKSSQADTFSLNFDFSNTIFPIGNMVMVCLS